MHTEMLGLEFNLFSKSSAQCIDRARRHGAKLLKFIRLHQHNFDIIKNHSPEFSPEPRPVFSVARQQPQAIASDVILTARRMIGRTKTKSEQMVICSAPQRVPQHRGRLKNQHSMAARTETELRIHGINVQAFLKQSQPPNRAGRHHASRRQSCKYPVTSTPQSELDAGFAVHIERSNESNIFSMR